MCGDSPFNLFDWVMNDYAWHLACTRLSNATACMCATELINTGGMADVYWRHTSHSFTLIHKWTISMFHHEWERTHVSTKHMHQNQSSTWAAPAMTFLLFIQLQTLNDVFDSNSKLFCTNKHTEWERILSPVMEFTNRFCFSFVFVVVFVAKLLEMNVTSCIWGIIVCNTIRTWFLIQ